MLLKEYIEILQEIAKEHGDNLVLIYSADDEGNRFQAVHYPPGPQFWDGKQVIDDPGAGFSPGQYNAVCIN